MPLTEEQIDGMAALFSTEELQQIHDVVGRILEERSALDTSPGDPSLYSDMTQYVLQHIRLNGGTTAERIHAASSGFNRSQVDAALEVLVGDDLILLHEGGYFTSLDEVRGENPQAIVIRLAREGQDESAITQHLLSNRVAPTPALRTLTRWAVRYAGGPQAGGWPDPTQALRDAERSNAQVEAAQQGRSLQGWDLQGWADRARAAEQELTQSSVLPPVSESLLSRLVEAVRAHAGLTPIELAEILGMDREELVNPLAHLVAHHRVTLLGDGLYPAVSEAELLGRQDAERFIQGPTPGGWIPLPLVDTLLERLRQAIGGMTWPTLLATSPHSGSVTRVLVERLVQDGRVVIRNGVVQAVPETSQGTGEMVSERWAREQLAQHDPDPSSVFDREVVDQTEGTWTPEQRARALSASVQRFGEVAQALAPQQTVSAQEALSALDQLLAEDDP